MIYMIPPSSRHTLLPLQVVLIGNHHNQERIYRPSGMIFFQCFFCREGVGEFIVDGKKQIIREGEGFLIYPGCPHEYEALSDNWRLDFLGFTGNLSQILLEQLGMSESGAYHFYDKRYFEESLQHMVHHYQANPEDALGLSVCSYELLLSLPRLTAPLLENGEPETSPVIHTVIRYIEEHYQESVTLDAIAEACHYSKPHLCTLFKSEMKQTINDFLTNFRMSKARVYLLQNPTKKVYEIARECGYQDASYFCRLFRIREGQTPDQFRKSKSYIL